MIVCGLQLNAGERDLLIQQCDRFSVHETITPGVLARGDVCCPDLPLSSVLDLPAWGRPVLVWGGESVRAPDVRHRLFEAGIAALWLPSGNASGSVSGNAGDFFVPPPVSLASRSDEQACLVLPPGGAAGVIKQLFLFAGIAVRADFCDASDFAVALPSLRDNEKKTVHLVIDLNRPDFGSALHALSKEPRAPDAGLHVWALRDFALPGPDPALIQRLLSPFSSRVFEPLEAIVALVEALFLSGEGLDRRAALSHPLGSFEGFRDADHLLRGRSVQLLHSDPRRLWRAATDLIERLRPSLAFHWLLDFYEEQRRGGGLLLAASSSEGRQARPGED